MSGSPKPHTPEQVDARVRQVEIAISNLLRAGVLISLGLVLAGLSISFLRHPELASSREVYRDLVAGRSEYPHSIPAVIRGLRELSGRSIIMAGLLLLIATPVARVAVSVLAFVYQRDRKFVFITLVVLTLLIASFILGTTAA